MESSLDFFSQTQDDLTNLIFGDAKRFSFDSTGRIVLSEKLMKHAQITDMAVFVGKGKKFQIWNPQNWEKEEARIRAEIMKNRPSLMLNKGTEGHLSISLFFFFFLAALCSIWDHSSPTRD